MNPARLPAPIANRIRLDDSGCWIWTGTIDPAGYGRKSYQTAHRLVYTLLKGAIPEGLSIDHLCRVRACCNPEHLDAVTPAENVMRSPIAIGPVNASKTECLRGHPFAGDNLYVAINRNGRPRRRCKACDQALRRGRRKAAA